MQNDINQKIKVGVTHKNKPLKNPTGGNMKKYRTGKKISSIKRMW